MPFLIVIVMLLVMGGVYVAVENKKADSNNDNTNATKTITTAVPSSFKIVNKSLTPVINSKPSITVLSPYGGEKYFIGGKIDIRYNIISVPSGSYLTLALVGGPTPMDIKSTAVSSGVVGIDYVIPANGCRTDYCYDLKPGNYNIEAILYDKEPCGAMAICPVPAKVFIKSTSKSFTIDQ